MLLAGSGWGCLSVCLLAVVYLSLLRLMVCLNWSFVIRSVASAGIIVGGLPSAFPVAVAELLG